MSAICIKNGHVIDTTQKLDSIADIFINDGKITLASSADQRIIDATGCYVLPGLIDFHTHLYKGSTFGVDPDSLIATGVTAATDAGTAGWVNFEDFYNNSFTKTKIHLKAFINVSGIGQPGGGINEPLDLDAINYERLLLLLKKYHGDLLGLKIRISKPIVKQNGITPLINTMKFAHANGLHVNVHVTNPAAPTEEILPLFEKGDIFCHVFHGTGDTIIGPNNMLKKELLEARERGVLFDAANGRSNFVYKVAKKAIDAGFCPDIISSDTTAYNFNIPGKVKNLPFVMSKYLSLGMPLPKIIQAATETPAKIMGMENIIGTLKNGACGDVTICKFINKKITFLDTFNNIHYGEQLLVPVMTILKGNVVYCQTDFDD